ncbi:MAG TPA: Gfo/Idh/MocA family oxidoreductase [Acidobacteriota bacterium]|nr:Gfo/Idh/MocA family oxidoreductase [Acidobacteriota bacterium]
MQQTKGAMGRRQFIGTGLLVGAAASSAAAASPSAGATQASASKKQRIALVGTGSRGTVTWGRGLIHPFKDYVEMVALCDINPKRVKEAQKQIGTDAPTYLAADFDRMIRETKPDTVIITTPDCFHADYAVRAMELGVDVVCEKPLATDEKQCQLLLDTEARTGGKLITTFNARFGASSEEIKKILLSGELGQIIAADFHEYLDTSHGADYFRRWHGKMRFSGSLLVHKASHHFDQMNWWLDAEPEEVHAYGKVAFYGKNGSFRGKNCRSCAFTQKCDFYWDITKNERMKALYVACEDEDGYLRDGCVFDQSIDTYDTMTVQVTYNNGVLLTYTLHAFMPYEGQTIAFTGAKGRLDVRCFSQQPWPVEEDARLRLTLNFKGTREWTLAKRQGEHGGADDQLKELLFRPGHRDPLNRRAGSRAGVLSSLIGIAARQSIETGETVRIKDLVTFPLQWGWA